MRILKTAGFAAAIVSATIAQAATLAHAAPAATAGVQNPHTCSLVLDVHAPAVLSGGTGSYAGISGTVTLSSNFAAIFPHKSGSSGTCNFDTSPLSTALSTGAEGRISFS